MSKIVNDVVEYSYSFRKAFTRFDFTCWRLSTDTSGVMWLYKWPRTLHSCGWNL